MFRSYSGTTLVNKRPIASTILIINLTWVGKFHRQVLISFLKCQGTDSLDVIRAKHLVVFTVINHD